MTTEQISSNKKEKIDSLQALRASAFLGIFLSHCKVISLGVWGVSVFFVLSGFLMTYSYYDRDLSLSPVSSLKFAIGKTGKLYSLHLITMLANLILPVLFSGAALLGEVRNHAGKMLLNALLVQAWIPSSEYYFSMNGVAWFLSSILFLYFLFPYLLRLVRRISSIPKAILWMILVYLIQIVIARIARTAAVPKAVSDNFNKWLTYICPAFRFGDFCIGGLLGFIFIRTRAKEGDRPEPMKKCIAYNTLFEVGAVALFVVSQMVYSKTIIINGIWLNYYSCLFLPSSLLLVWIFAGRRGLITKLLSRKWMIYLGNLSSYAFLIHLVAIKYVQKSYVLISKSRMSGIALACVSLLITIVLSYVCSKIQRKRKLRIRRVPA